LAQASLRGLVQVPVLSSGAMSTAVLFELHKANGEDHRESAQMWLQDAHAVWQHGLPSSSVDGSDCSSSELALEGLLVPPEGPLNQKASKALRCALAQQKLAVREYTEASRHRPRDVAVRSKRRQAEKLLHQLQTLIEGPKRIPLRRFLAHYNLSIRYWDLGKAAQAIAEARSACREIDKAGLDCGCGCAAHNLEIMQKLHAEGKEEHRRLTAELQRRPHALEPNWELGRFYFRSRMLLRAQAQMKWTRDLFRTRRAGHLLDVDRRLRASEGSAVKELPGPVVWMPAAGDKALWLAEKMEILENDLDFIAGLRGVWCVEDEDGKACDLQDTGIRDGARPKLLPCLRRRHAEEMPECEHWWRGLCSRVDVDLQAAPPPASPAPTTPRPKSRARIGRSYSAPRPFAPPSRKRPQESLATSGKERPDVKGP